MTNFEQSISSDSEHPDDVSENRFRAFVRDGGYTSDQVRAAYYRLCGIEDVPSNDSAIHEIYDEMKRLEEEHFPISRFAQVVEVRQAVEGMIPLYYEYVEALPLSEKEKTILRSIVEGMREGEIEFFVDDKPFGTMRIGRGTASRESLAASMVSALRDALSGVKAGSKLEIMFSEK